VCLNAAVVAMREQGLTPGGINVRLRSINSFLTWLHEEGHLHEPLRVKRLENPPEPIQTLSDQDVKRLVTHRPKGRIETRTWMLALVLLDCVLGSAKRSALNAPMWISTGWRCG